MIPYENNGLNSSSQKLIRECTIIIDCVIQLSVSQLILSSNWLVHYKMQILFPSFGYTLENNFLSCSSTELKVLISK